jgi:sporulation protein YlmC with PRC-barrel domain
MMFKKVVVGLACLALVALAGTALAQSKSEPAKPAPAQPQAQPAKPQPQPQNPQVQPQPAQVPVAGFQPVALGVTVNEMVVVTNGWSVKKQIMGKAVYNDKNQKIGKVYDLIVAPDKAISYAIIAVGGFLGIDKHDVAIPVNQFKLAKGKIILPGATKDALKALPSFQYAK